MIPIPPLKKSDLPKRERSFWQLAGPGAIMIGLAIGSGEMLLWPWITAKFGTQMMWAAAMGVFLQLWINIEIGRYAVATGESAFTGFARISKFWVFFFITLLFVGVFLPGLGRAVGTSVRILIFGEEGPQAEWFRPDWLWTAFVSMTTLSILFGPKVIYKTVERAVSSMVLLIFVGMIIVAVSVGTLEQFVQMLIDVVRNFGRTEFTEDFTFNRFFGAFVFAGIGGLGNLFYAYYLRDKGIGMGKLIPALLNPLREAQRGDSATGFEFPDDAENSKRFREWFRFVIADQCVFFWIANTLTMFLFMFGALVVLHPSGNVPAENQIIWDMGDILTEVMGTWGKYLFVIIGISAFFSSVLAGADGGIRLWVDLLHSNFGFTHRFAANRMYLVLAIFFACTSVTATYILETFEVTILDFFFINAMLQGFAMAGYVPMLLYMNLTRLPEVARPRLINIVMVSIGALVYVSFAVYTIYAKISATFFG